MQGVHAPVSSLHSKVEGVSVDVNTNVADVAGVAAGGFDVMLVSGAVASIVHVYDAGDGSVLVAASIARTWNVWLPSPRPLYDFGFVHGAHEPESSLHSNVAGLSVDVKPNVGFGVFDGSDGVTEKLVSGGVVSTVHVCVAGVPSLLPAASFARTSSVCGVSERPVKVTGSLHAAQPAASRLHSNVASGSSDEKSKVAIGEFVGFAGPETMVVVGSAVSRTVVVVLLARALAVGPTR